jgi:glycosyltransferase involved in cell wall biosynthesis
VIGDARAKLFQEAKGVFVPTVYVEPFGGVAVEAQLAGTPVITTDWGAFTETVEHGKTGYRCRTLDHFTFAAQNVVNLDPFYIHKRAVANWSMDHVRWMYQEYFQMLSDLWGKGWYAERNRTQLDWLR